MRIIANYYSKIKISLRIVVEPHFQLGLEKFTNLSSFLTHDLTATSQMQD